MAMRNLLGVVARRTPVYRGGGRNPGGSQWGMWNGGSSPAAPGTVRPSCYDRIAYGCGSMDPIGLDVCPFDSHSCSGGGMGLHPYCLPSSALSAYGSSNGSFYRQTGYGITPGGGLGRGGLPVGLPPPPTQIPYYSTTTSSSCNFHHYHTQSWRGHRLFSTSPVVGSTSLAYEEKTYARDVLEYNEVLYKLSRSKRAYLLRDVYEDMLMDGVRPNRDTYHLLIPACMKAHRLQDVMYFFGEMKATGLIPDLVLFNCVISTCGRCFQVRKAFEVAEEMKALGIQPKLRTFVALLNACGTSGRVEEAYEVVQLMASHGLTLNKYCYSALITAYKNRRPVTPETFSKIFELLDQSRAQSSMSGEDDVADSTYADEYDEVNEESAWLHGVPAKRGLITHKAAVYNAALRACVDLHNHEAAMKVLDRIKEDGLKPDGYVFTHLIRSYLMQGDMDEAVATFDKYMATGGHPSLDIFMIMIEGAIRRYKPETMELAKRLLKMMEEHGYFLNPKFGGQLLSLAAREHGGDFSTANMIWDMLEAQNRKLQFKAAFAYLQGLHNRGTDPNDPRLLAVKSLVNPDLMKLQKQNGGVSGGGSIGVMANTNRPWNRGGATRRQEMINSMFGTYAGVDPLEVADLNNEDEYVAEYSDEEEGGRKNSTTLLGGVGLSSSLD